jgi:hypothetical protein
MQHLRKLLMAAALASAVIAPASAEQPSAQLTFTGDSVAAGVGFTWGRGDLHFNGHDYAFTVHGLSVVDVGVARVDGTGDVFDLKRIEDFPGNYVAASAGVTVGGGGNVAVLQNQNGVRIYVRSTTQGLKLNLSADGISVALK